MKIFYRCIVLTIKFRKISFVRCQGLFRCVSLPLLFRPPPGQLRLGNLNCNFSTDSSIEYENLLTRADVQEYLKFINNEYEKYVYKEKGCQNEILTYINEVKKCEDHLKNLKSLSTNGDEELDKLVKVEEEQFRNKIKYNYSKILSLAFSEDKDEAIRGAIIEVTPGVGGVEAKLFAEEVFEMYLKYIAFKGWNIDYMNAFTSESGGIVKGEVCVLGETIFNFLKHEAGIHRVQRVPKTEKFGRIQTSTCRVHVLPDIVSNEIILKASDLKIEKKLSSGPGGQNIQKTETSVKITHLPTGLSAQSQRERFQYVNMTIALNKLKNLLREREQKQLDSEEIDLKKKQAATILRPDKIRTYNFSHNKVVDHRISHTSQNVKLFMEGTNGLDEMICLLNATYKRESLLRNISRLVKEKNVDVIFKKKATKS